MIKSSSSMYPYIGQEIEDKFIQFSVIGKTIDKRPFKILCKT
jgi:hypothetical protein